MLPTQRISISCWAFNLNIESVQCQIIKRVCEGGYALVWAEQNYLPSGVLTLQAKPTNLLSPRLAAESDISIYQMRDKQVGINYA